MMVPIELLRLVNRTGYLSPELALGWRVGAFLEEFFDGLELLRISAKTHAETALSLEAMLGWSKGDRLITAGDGEPPWVVRCYHPPTGTLLQVRPVAVLTTLPWEIEQLQPLLSKEARASQVYSKAVGQLVARLVKDPIESYCAIDEHLCRRASTQTASRCRKCGARTESWEMWYRGGVLCCSSCAGLDTRWFDRQ